MQEMHFQGPGFHMQVPTNWFITSNPQVQVMLVSPSQNGIRANFMVTLRSLEPTVTLSSVVASALETQKKEYPEFALLEEGDYTKGQVVGHLHSYKWFNQRHSTLIFQRQVIFVNNQILTSLTTTRTDGVDGSEVDAVFNRILGSFQFEN